MSQPTRSAKHLLLAVASPFLLLACSRNPEPVLVETPVRVAPPEGAIAAGDCIEARRRARLNTDMAVDRLPTPRTKLESSLRDRSMPAAVRRAKWNSVVVSALVDTLGKADMRTFTIVKTTHPWLAERLKLAVPKTVFDPALLAGCKVPRLWLGEYNAGTPPRK
ncbi:MAG: hypothetical protein H7247_13590 [Polaromonas sp.]|nr:hypothetical protein [Gemmatimonadaceae bacterium]